MITQTIPITGTIREIRDGRILTSSGDRRDSYNQRYYRPSYDAQHEVRRHAPDKHQTFHALLKMAMLAKAPASRDVYTGQYLTMMRRRLPK